jgi:hypothetical protein
MSITPHKLMLGSTTGDRKVYVATMSFMADESVSFVLNDRTFVSPLAQMGQMFVFNLYNQVRAEFLVEHDPRALRPVPNPHFTFHPAIRFHLVGRSEGQYQTLFDGIMDVDLMLQTYQKPVPWLRAISKPISQVKSAGLPSGSSQAAEHLVTTPSEDFSIGMEIDFLPAGHNRPADGSSVHVPIWRDHELRVSLSLLTPQVATLAWYHFH